MDDLHTRRQRISVGWNGQISPDDSRAGRGTCRVGPYLRRLAVNLQLPIELTVARKYADGLVADALYLVAEIPGKLCILAVTVILNRVQERIRVRLRLLIQNERGFHDALHANAEREWNGVVEN